MHSILFICHGNICRSTMAQFVMEDMVRKARLGGKFSIDSAATSTEEIGELPHPGTLKSFANRAFPRMPTTRGRCGQTNTASGTFLSIWTGRTCTVLSLSSVATRRRSSCVCSIFFPMTTLVTARTLPTRGTPAISTRLIETSSPGVAACSQSWKASVRSLRQERKHAAVVLRRAFKVGVLG